MKFDWKNALVPVAIAFVGIKLLAKLVVPILEGEARPSACRKAFISPRQPWAFVTTATRLCWSH